MTEMTRVARRPRASKRLFSTILLVLFIILLVGVIGSVLLDSFATQWFAGWLPDGYTGHWYSDAWTEFGLGHVLLVTFEIALIVVAVSLLIAVPAAYVLARQNFPFKRAVSVLFLLPVVVPTITYGVPLATLLYRVHLAGTLAGVVVINLVPSVPFAILVLVPFVEQIDESIENAARVFGARGLAVFIHVVTPLLRVGVIAAAILLLVRTVSMFDLTFLVSGPTTQTLVVELFYAVSAPGFRANQSIDAMAVLYMATNAVLLAAAFRFTNPSRLVHGGR
jgi:putative spermidine/putrescine transport system permease protein